MKIGTNCLSSLSFRDFCDKIHAMEFALSLKRWGAYAIHIVALPLFLVCFLLAFDPRTLGNETFSEVFASYYTLNVLMYLTISLAVLSLTRLVFFFICRIKKVNMTWFWYSLWCIMEVVILSQFLTLYSALMLDLSYLPALALCIRLIALILVFPYVILALSFYVHDLSGASRMKQDEDGSLLRLYDENQKLKLVIAPSAVLYLQSDENYVKVYYLESGKLKTYTLRNSMKSLETSAGEHGLVRCHRSYLVNPNHVKVLKKEAEGSIIAELDIDMASSVPVSKRYYENLSDLL